MKVVVRIISLGIGALCALGTVGATEEIGEGKTGGYPLAVFFGMTLFLIVHAWRVGRRRERKRQREARRPSIGRRKQRRELKRQRQVFVRDLPYPIQSAPSVADDEYPEFTGNPGYATPFHPHIDGGRIKQFDDEVGDGA